jgi:hypothetical protein
MENSFLKSFLQMRQGLDAGSREPRARHVGMGRVQMPEPAGMSVMRIIEELPDKKEVLEFLKKRIEEFEEDD